MLQSSLKAFRGEVIVVKVGAKDTLAKILAKAGAPEWDVHSMIEAPMRPIRAALGAKGIGDELPRSRPSFATWSALTVLGAGRGGRLAPEVWVSDAAAQRSAKDTAARLVLAAWSWSSRIRCRRW